MAEPTESKLSRFKLNYERIPGDKELKFGQKVPTERLTRLMRAVESSIEEKQAKQSEFTQKMATIIAGVLMLTLLVMGMALIFNFLMGYNVNDQQATCNSIGGVWSSQSNRCFYGGKAMTVEEALKATGVRK